MNRKITVVLSVLAIGASASACGSSTGSDAGDSETIKVAIIPPTSGALAQFGTDEANGWQLAVDEVNAKGGIDGKKVELIKKSTDMKPATTIRAAREAVTKQGAAFLAGVITSPETSALNQQLAGLKVLAFNHLGKDDALIGKDCSVNAFHTVQTNGMDITALAKSLGDLPGDKWAIQAVDYSTGHTAAAEFTKAVKAAGKEVVTEQFAPLNTTDFGSYITKLKDSGADALFAVEFGADGVAFVKQSAQFKLTQQFKTVLGFNMVSEPLFPAIGKLVPDFYNNVGYDVNGDNELNKEFVASYQEKFQTKPYYVPADAYLAAETLFAGIDKAGTTDPAKVTKALEGLSFDSIVGKVTMRAEDHQLVRPTYLGQVTGSGADQAFKIISETPGEEIVPEPSADCSM